MNTALTPVATTTTHPLEPLTADEVAKASAILREELGLEDDTRFVFVMLHEPPKGAGLGAPRAAEGRGRRRPARGRDRRAPPRLHRTDRGGRVAQRGARDLR